MSDHQTSNDFLNSINMTVDSQYHSVFTTTSKDAPLLTGNFISPLSYYGILAIEGPDTEKFLQGQATCDAAAVNKTQSCGGAFCNVKGRMVSSFQLATAEENQFLLKMRRELVDTTQARLSKYMVFSKAEQRNANEEYCLIGLHGSQAKTNIEQVFGAYPIDKNACLQRDGSIVIQVDDSGESFECWIPSAQLEQLWPALQSELAITGSRTWELLTIAQGLGEISANTTELFIPQMLNYQITGAVSFTKGCYTGQEIVARMQYKGKLKRQMYRIKIADSGFSAGDELFNPSNGKSVGNIVNVQTVDQHSEALAVITSKDVAQNTVTAGKQQATIEILPLPYAITIDDN